MTIILDDEYSPITNEFGAIEVGLDRASNWLLKRQTDIFKSIGFSITGRPVSGPLPAMLKSLLPLTNVRPRRFLLVGTGGPWTLYFDNSWPHADAAGLSVAAKDLQCKAVRIVHRIDRTVSTKDWKVDGGYGATMFELYGPSQSYFPNYLRTISAAVDGNNWEFDQSGTPLECEDPAWYRARRVRDRFTGEHLAKVLEGIRLDILNPNLVTQRGTLVELHGPFPKTSREVTLAEARVYNGLSA